MMKYNVGDYVRNKTDKDKSKRIVYTDVVAPTISRAEWEEVQNAIKEMEDEVNE